MAKSWGDYFFMIGSAAASLIGLMFVVVTLTAGRGRQEVEWGKQLYTSPIVFHLAAVLVLSGAALAPLSPKIFAIGSSLVALLGVSIGVRSALGIARRPATREAAGFDIFWYGVAPALAYVATAVSAAAMLLNRKWGEPALAGDLMGLLLVSIHAEWDLVTYLAPIAGIKDQDNT